MQRSSPLLNASRLLSATRIRMSSSYTINQRGGGKPYSLESRIFFKNDGKYISPFHDIPLYANAEKTILNMIVEIPRWTNAKMEISTSEPLNPIKQDVKKGKLRFVDNCFPYHGYIWNYGAFPQTWEYPGHVDSDTGCKGDNDPLDVCEIGSHVVDRGQVIQVKVIGTIALIDEGETDWKILAINVNDELAPQINDIHDVQNVMPGLIENTVNWFKIYKMPTGSEPNKFAFNGQPKDKAFAYRVIETTNEQWKDLVSGKVEKGTLDITNTTLSTSTTIDQTKAEGIVNNVPEVGTDQPAPDKVSVQHYIKL